MHISSCTLVSKYDWHCLSLLLLQDFDTGLSMLQANEEERSSAGAGLSLTLDDLESGSAEAEHTQSDGRIILDDIDWDLVSEQHGTRTAAQCLTKWYTQLAPSMVTKGQPPAPKPYVNYNLTCNRLVMLS